MVLQKLVSHQLQPDEGDVSHHKCHITLAQQHPSHHTSSPPPHYTLLHHKFHHTPHLNASEKNVNTRVVHLPSFLIYDGSKDVRNGMPFVSQKVKRGKISPIFTGGVQTMTPANMGRRKRDNKLLILVINLILVASILCVESTSDSDRKWPGVRSPQLCPLIDGEDIN